MNLKPIEQQIIVITGATSGIGLATAKMAAERGAHVILFARDEEGLRHVCNDIRADGGTADFIVGDVGKREDVRRAVDEVVSRYGGFDTWVNNAGVAAYAKIEDLSDEDHERMFQTNYWGVVYGSTEALRHLRQKGGALINMGSISSEMPAPILSGYTATKFAVKGFTDSLRLELIHDKAPVSVTLIQPSGIHTPFGDHARNYMDHASKVPPPVYAPELVAKAVLHAAQHPTRSTVVGGAGQLMVWGARFLPKLTDAIYSRAFFLTALDKSRPPRETHGGFHEAGDGGRLYGDQDDPMRKWSVYTAFQTRPVTTTAVALGLGVAGMALASYLLRPRPQGTQTSTRDEDDLAVQPTPMSRADQGAAQPLH